MTAADSTRQRVGEAGRRPGCHLGLSHLVVEQQSRLPERDLEGQAVYPRAAAEVRRHCYLQHPVTADVAPDQVGVTNPGPAARVLGARSERHRGAPGSWLAALRKEGTGSSMAPAARGAVRRRCRSGAAGEHSHDDQRHRRPGPAWRCRPLPPTSNQEPANVLPHGCVSLPREPVSLWRTHARPGHRRRGVSQPTAGGGRERGSRTDRLPSRARVLHAGRCHG
jgi:hypothetical protein